MDVAQGAAAIILLGNGRAILIDCGGRQTRTVLAALRHFRVTTITALVVTHNHADHSAGAVAILNDFSQRIESIWLVFDTVLQDSIFWARVQEEIDAGLRRDDQVFRLEYRNAPSEVYRAAGVLLAVIAPSMMANLRAVFDANPNATSGVLALKANGTQVLFTGDSTIPQWQRIYATRGRPITCSVATIPHHGGKMWQSQQTGETAAAYAARVMAELDWFYTDAVRADLGLVSVGTSNTYKHPRPDVLDGFRRHGGHIVCTQMTRQCDPALEVQRRRALPIILPSRSSSQTQRTGKGSSNNVACGGTIRVLMLPSGTTVQRLHEHTASVDQVPVVAGTRPLCRR